jgi:GNAT superfamily N-acetyltransferase
VRQLSEHRRVLAEAGARFFVAFADGAPASRCELYPGSDVAQIEDVGTVEAFRNRGLSRAVVLRAVAEARASGAGTVFLEADEDDWPKDLYGRLGFDVLGRWSAFHQPGPV